MSKTPSLHAVSLTEGEIVEESDLGPIRRVTVDNFLILRGLSIKRVVINPGDIGYRASMSAYSREVLAATFNVHIDDLPDFPFTNADPLIITRNNPLDEHAMGEH